MDHPSRYQFRSIFSSRNLLRLICIGLLGVVISFFIGIAFVLIFIGLFSFIIRLSVTNKPVFTFLSNLLFDSKDQKKFIKPNFSNIGLTIYILHSMTYILLAFGGFWILCRLGFLGQNIIYQLLIP
jgi:hypothetical protein